MHTIGPASKEPLRRLARLQSLLCSCSKAMLRCRTAACPAPSRHSPGSAGAAITVAPPELPLESTLAISKAHVPDPADRICACLVDPNTAPRSCMRASFSDRYSAGLQKRRLQQALHAQQLAPTTTGQAVMLLRVLRFGVHWWPQEWMSRS